MSPAMRCRARRKNEEKSIMLNHANDDKNLKIEHQILNHGTVKRGLPA